MRPILIMLVLLAFLALSCTYGQEAPSGNALTSSTQATNQVGSLAADDESLESQIRNAFLTLSAFECTIVAPNAQESERLFGIGLRAGREFFAFTRSNRDRFETTVKSKVPLEWYLFTREEELRFGPTADFVLGRLFAGQVHEVNVKRTAPNEQLIKVQGDDIYRDRNCALIAGN